MKLTLESLGAHLAETLLPLYLISGDEPLLVGEAADAIRVRARQRGFDEREVHFIERGSAVWDGVHQAAQALSLFASRRLIEIRMPSGKPGVAGATALRRLFDSAGTDFSVLVITDKLERDSQNADWVQALQQRGAWLPIWPVPRPKLPAWLRARFALAGLNPTDDALTMLADRSEGNLLAAQQEIDKLALLLPRAARVSAAEVAAGSADSARFDVFQLAEAVRAGDAGRALRILGGLQAEGGEALVALWALLRELRGAQSASGGSGRIGRIPYARLSARAARVDRMAKGLANGDAWDELALLAVELTGTRTLPLLRLA